MTDLITRRRFFQALAASALAAGVPLPIGFPEGVKWAASGPGDLVREYYFVSRFKTTGLLMVWS